jgi:hypothetical protein
MQASPSDAWLTLLSVLIRLGSGVLGLLLIGTGIRGLRGRSLVVPAGRSVASETRVVEGAWARIFGLLALFIAAFFLSVAFGF